MRPRKAVDTSTYSGRFAVRLRQLRDERGLSIPELAAITGVPYRTQQNWENGTNFPQAESFPILAKAFGISIAELLPKE